MNQLEDVEYAKLSDQVRQIETLVNSGQPEGVGFLLQNFLSNAKSRMEEIRHEEFRLEQDKKEQHTKEAASVAHLVELEHKLNAEEKQQYAGFLKLDHFTKANFDDLDEFYSNTWDKLSEKGKTQMSTRVWEGIKRHEYTFDELPEKVREKESERIYLQLTGKIEASASLQNVPQQDRTAFVREYESGNEKAASNVLSRPAFAEYSPDTRAASALQAGASARGKTSEGKEKPTKGSFEGVGSLEGLTLCEATDVIRPNLAPAAGSTGVEKS